MINTISDSRESTKSFISEFPKMDDFEKLAKFETLGKVSGDNDGRLIKDENEEVVRVKISTFWKLLNYGGGIKFIIL